MRPEFWLIPRYATAALVTAALCVLSANWSQAAAPVLSPPKPGLTGKNTGTPPSGLPEPTLPGQNNGATKAEPKHNHGDDHDTKQSSSVIETVELPKLPVLARTVKATWEEGYGAIRSAITALRAEATRANLEPKGRPLIVYIESGDKDFRVDILLPLASEPAKGVSKGVTLSSGFRTGHNPGGKALKFEHRGAYASIETTYEAITAYLDTKNLSAREFFIEEFVNDVADPADIKMAVNIYVFLK